MKKAISFVLCFVIILSASVCASAADDISSLSRLGITDGTIMPYVNTPCTGGNGKCQMQSSGHGFLWDVENNRYILSYASCWQCKNCLTVLVTEGDPLCNQAIGRYCFWPCNYKINKNGCIIDVTEDMVYYTSSTRLEGYTFEYV